MAKTMTLLELHDAIALAMADAVGNGMREKFERHADAVMTVVGPQLLAAAEQAERIKADEGLVDEAVLDRACFAAINRDRDAMARHVRASYHEQLAFREDVRAALFAVWPAPPAQAAQVDADELRVLRADAKSAIGMVELLKQARQRLDDVHAQLYCLRTIIDQHHATGALLEYTDKVIALSRYQTAEDAASAEPVAQHPDDAAVDAFAEAMKAKLAEARAKGRGGWRDKADCTQQRLSDMLRAHVEKGDPRDVANFCMFLHQRGEAILPGESIAQGEVVARFPVNKGGAERETATRNAWKVLLPALAPEDWSAGESTTYYGFFCWGWEAASQYHEVAITSAQAAQPRAVPDGIAALIKAHAELLESNPYCYFELAYTRQTEWMAWLCSKPAEDDPDRKILARGQGNTPNEACMQALGMLALGMLAAAPSPGASHA